MILLLAGTAEARVIAKRLRDAGRPVIAALAGSVRKPKELGVATRVGGFGGEAGFVAFLDVEKITAVIDATHPYAARISRRTAQVCDVRGLPYLRLDRPGWTAGPGDDWHWVDYMGQAAGVIPFGATVFMATGRQSLADAGALATGRTLWLRVVDPPEIPFPHAGGFVQGQPPFSAASDTALFQKLGVKWIIAKDSGGAENRGKLDAARDLGLPVVMIRRPFVPGPGVTTVAAVMDWVADV